MVTRIPYTEDKDIEYAARAIVPRLPHGVCIYNADGASRCKSNTREAACGAVLWINGSFVAHYGVYLGDETNNVAEYRGALEVLKHVWQFRAQRNILRLDSLLVARQLNGIWACKAQHLRPMYEECLRILSLIRHSDDIQSMAIEHVYREFNAEADAMANESIDEYLGTRVSIINRGWHPFNVSQVLSHTLHDPDHGERDIQGDVAIDTAPEISMDRAGDDDRGDLQAPLQDSGGDAFMDIDFPIKS